MEDEDGPVVRRYDVIKSENDDRLYRGFKLSNEMKVLLINDPTTDKAAAALDIRVGFTADPRIMPGLAHLYQHALYLTNEDTSQRNFKAYVKQNDGTVSGKMHENYTGYYFDIDSSKFKNALIYFAEFFTKPPIFTETVIKAEISNLTREYETNKLDDKWKTNRLFKWTISPHDTISKFGVGCAETLTGEMLKQKGIDIIKMLQIFHERCYSAEIMTLCILGKESLDELENLIVKLFSQVKKNIPELSPHYDVSQSCISSVYKIYYAPHGTYKRLYIIFYLWSYVYWRCRPSRFLAYLFEYDGRGSLMSVLKARGWGNFIEAGVFPGTNEKLFVVTVDLTEEGLEHVDDIMTVFFQYVNMLKENNGLRGIYNEYKEIEELKFRFKEKEAPLKYVKLVARTMQNWSVKEALRGEFILAKWGRDCVQAVIESFLSPLGMRIYVAAEKYQNITDDIEPWCGYKYKMERIPAKTCARWINARHNVELDFPACNEFIPTMTSVKPCEDDAKKFPTIIKDTRLITLWHKKDDEFNEPRATMIFHFVSPLAYTDAVNANFTLMFVRLINKSLSKYVYPTALVDLHWELCATISGIQLKISGFDNKQHVLLEKIVDRMVNFKLNPTNFEVDRQDNINISMKEFEKFQNDDPYRQAQYYLSLLLSDHLWEKKQILKASAYTTFEKVQDFISKFFSAVHVKGLIHGNVTRAEALDIARIIESKLPHVIALPNLSLYRDIKLENECHFIFDKENMTCLNSCILVFYQIDRRSLESDMLLDLAQQIIDDSCCDTLKEKKELGYIVCAGVHRSNKMQGLTILVQNREPYINKYNAEKQIYLFMHSMVDYVLKISKKTFEMIKASFVETRYAKKPKTLNDLSNAFWTEILNQQCNFDRANAEIDCLHKITLHEIRDFFEELMDNKTPQLSVYVTSKNNYRDTEEFIFKSKKYTSEIDDITSFKSSQILCSVPQSP